MPNTSVTTYALPSDVQIGNAGSLSDEVSKARRVQQQVQMRLAEKSTLPRQNGSTSHYASSEYGGSSTMKYHTLTPNFSSKSHMYASGAKTMGPRVSQRTGFSARSAGPDLAQFHRMSMGSGVAGGGGYYVEDIRMRQPSRMESGGDMITMQSMRQQVSQVNPWLMDNSDASSMISDRDATYGRQYAHSAVNGHTYQMRQTGGTMPMLGTMRRSLSGTLSRSGGGGMMGGMAGGMTEIVQQPSYKGPAHRTINRITNRTNRMSMGSMSGTMQQSTAGSSYGGGERVDGGFLVGTMSSASQRNLSMPRQGTISRAMSMKSVHSVGRGMDMGASIGNLSGIATLDMATAVQNLREVDDPEMQVLGAAYIQHQCYNDSESKDEVRQLNGISDLVRLFNSPNPEVRRYVTGATRNLIYENMENKKALIEEGGITELVKALGETDDELSKNITGILWNLSSKDNLKEKLARETLPELTEKVLIPLSGELEDSEKISDGGPGGIDQSPSQAEIFCNTTGCLRNLSSVSEKTRQMMRETHGLVDSLVNYVRGSIEKNKAEEKGVENAVCVLRNLSYQLYNEIPPSVSRRLEGPTRDQDSGKNDTVGCFAPQSRKAKNKRNTSQHTYSAVSRVPKGMEWLWHPQIVGVYNRVLQTCEINSTTREAAAGALQNITAGDSMWASHLARVALEQERMLPVVLDLLRSNSDLELRSLTGFLRNLSRHATNKDDMSTKSVNSLVSKLPDDGYKKTPSSDVVVNICGVLNNLVTCSSMAARDITFFDGLSKLMGIKNSHDNSPGKVKAAKAAATVLTNMFNYKKLHKQYEAKGFTRSDFTDIII
ncbi:plakophilin-3 isoform X2 [Salarias fasciatus]|uniref:Plakophilin 3 n=1 Tax=Salarias fasciatus TaxID=181472 RepID=A0A672H6K7_SALFA|nr:plakophilin-3 isoform X2 [Salarias fasciatus]